MSPDALLDGLAAGTIILAYKAPDIYLKNKIAKRATAIRKGLPDALDLLVICAEAGLTVQVGAAARVADDPDARGADAVRAVTH